VQAIDAVVITLPELSAEEIADVEVQLGLVDGIEAAIPGEVRGPLAAVGALVFLKIAQQTLGATEPLVTLLDQTVDVLRRQRTVATITLPDGTVVTVRGSMSPEDVERTVRAAVSTFRGRGGGLPGTSDGDAGRIEFRLGFVLDAAGYSTRPVPVQQEVQRRLLTLVREVLLDIGADPDHVDFQGSGDGMIVLFPPDTQFQRVLPRLLRTMADRLRLDNGRYTDRLRLRMATAVGPVGTGAVGYTENTIIELCRLVESEHLRRELGDDPDVNLVALVSDVLYGYVVGAGYPGLEPSEFRCLQVKVKSFQAQAWLWTQRAAMTG
jgi:hypothetical protein